MYWSDVLSAIPNLPNVWGEGALFAFSGIDGETDTRSGFVATFAARQFGLLFHTPNRRILDVALPGEGRVLAVTSDVLCVAAPEGELIITWLAWHTLIGQLPTGARLALRREDGPAAARRGEAWISSAHFVSDCFGRDALVLIERDGRFALAYGRSDKEALARAEAGLGAPLDQTVEQRLAFLGSLLRQRQLPRLADPQRDRLLKKCASVMKVNTLAAEGKIRQAWSTPDRVPHRHMWLWDSVFHSLAMNHIDPLRSWEFLMSVLDAQRSDGMIPHMIEVSGRTSRITQPPILAWGVWENYLVLRDRDALAYALPRLERYLAWDCVNRDRNSNGLLEWFIEGDANCRSGESGLDNSPRFDHAIRLDAVDFSTFAAQDMACLAQIANELGEEARAVPSVSVSHPAWSTDMWRGATWVNLNYLIASGLRLHGRTREAERLAEQTIETVGRYYQQYGVLFEFFDSKDQRPPLACDRKGPRREPYNIRRKTDSIRDYHWTAALTACLIMESEK